MENPRTDLPEDILRRLSEGDEGAFRAAYDRYARIVFRTAYRYLRSTDLADDVVQEVFCILWDKRAHFTHVRNLEHYLISITSHQVYALFRRWASETRSCRVFLDDLELQIDNTDHIIRNQQSESLIKELIDRLPAQQRLVFTLSRDKGMTHEEIARELKLSQGTVKNHMVRALQFLRQNLSPHLSFYLLILAV